MSARLTCEMAHFSYNCRFQSNNSSFVVCFRRHLKLKCGRLFLFCFWHWSNCFLSWSCQFRRCWPKTRFEKKTEKTLPVFYTWSTKTFKSKMLFFSSCFEPLSILINIRVLTHFAYNQSNHLLTNFLDFNDSYQENISK